MFRPSNCVLLCAAFTVLVPAAIGDVLTVAPAGAAYAQIADAVAAASDGDVILVDSGGYLGFTIDGKTLSVVADAGANISVNEPVFVMNLAASQSVLLSGITLPQPFGGTALTLAQNAGPVRVQAVIAYGGQFVFWGSWYAVDVTNCADVSFVGCSFRGGGPAYGGLGYAHNGAPAIRATASVITLHDCTARGGAGLSGYPNAPGFPTSGQAGKPALDVVGSVLFARNSIFQGGDGGHGNSTDACPSNPYQYATAGGNGGPGVRVTTATAATLVAVTSIGGAPGAGGTNGCGAQASSGATGLPYDPPSLTPVSGPQVSMAVVEPAREGTNLSVHVAGPAGFRVLLAQSLVPGYASIPWSHGVLLIQSPLRRVSLGTIPATGVLDVQLAVPFFATGVEARIVHAQAVFVDTSGRSHLASPSVLVMLDQAF